MLSKAFVRAFVHSTHIHTRTCNKTRSLTVQYILPNEHIVGSVVSCALWKLEVSPYCNKTSPLFLCLYLYALIQSCTAHNNGAEVGEDRRAIERLVTSFIPPSCRRSIAYRARVRVLSQALLKSTGEPLELFEHSELRDANALTQAHTVCFSRAHV